MNSSTWVVHVVLFKDVYVFNNSIWCSTMYIVVRCRFAVQTLHNVCNAMHKSLQPDHTKLVIILSHNAIVKQTIRSRTLLRYLKKYVSFVFARPIGSAAIALAAWSYRSLKFKVKKFNFFSLHFHKEIQKCLHYVQISL